MLLKIVAYWDQEYAQLLKFAMAMEIIWYRFHNNFLNCGVFSFVLNVLGILKKKVISEGQPTITQGTL